MMRFNLKDGSFAAQGATLQHLIQMAYRIQDAQISGPADLLTKLRFTWTRNSILRLLRP